MQKRPIARLSQVVIDQIAAGEVIESPASVVKELVENSLDAGARHIVVKMRGGGLELLSIEDDGSGMDEGSALLAIERHATSKIVGVEDLDALETMGFRGEALSSIASISRFELKTSQGEVGTHLVVEGGRVVSVAPVARNRGTTIEVRDLFYNVPARKKFQKSAAASAAQIGRWIELFALAHPEVHFTLISGREVVREAPPMEGRLERIEALLGPHPYRGEGRRGESGAKVFLAPLEEALSRRMAQHLFINGRVVTSPMIAKAVREGVGHRLEERRYPSFVLFLEIPPAELDVNVHPQKREVRFEKEGEVFRLVREATQGAFAPSFLGGTFEASLPFSSPTRWDFQSVVKPLYIAEGEAVQSRFTLMEEAQESLEGMVVGAYLWVRQGERVYLVDLRRAKGRLFFEALKGRDEGVQQMLLKPLEAVFEGEIEALQKRGIVCRWMGKKRLLIEGLPQGIEEGQVAQLLEAIQSGEREERIAERVYEGRSFRLEEGLEVWRRLQRCQESKCDPLGRAIWCEVGEEAMRRMVDGG